MFRSIGVQRGLVSKKLRINFGMDNLKSINITYELCFTTVVTILIAYELKTCKISIFSFLRPSVIFTCG